MFFEKHSPEADINFSIICETLQKGEKQQIFKAEARLNMLIVITFIQMSPPH